MRRDHVDRGVPNRRCARYLWCGLAVVLGIGPVSAFAAWGLPKSPTVRGSAATVNAVRVGPGAYVPGSTTFNPGAGGAGGGYWSAQASWSASVGSTAVGPWKGWASGSYSQLGTAAAEAIGRGGSAVVLGAALLAVLDQAGLWMESQVGQWQKNDFPYGSDASEWMYRAEGYYANTFFNGPTPAAALDAACADVWSNLSQWGYGSCGTTLSGENGGWCGVVVDGTCSWNNVWRQIQKYQQCTPPLVWTGSSCADNTPTPRPATETDIEEAVKDGIGDPAVAADAWAAAESYPNTTIPDMMPPEPPYSGPATATGDSSTSTSSGPDGTTTTTKRTDYDMDYQVPGVVGITDRETTTTTTPDGQTTTTTSSTSGTSTANGGAGVPPAPPQSICSGDAKGSSACAQLDDVQQTELPTDTIDLDLSVTPSSGSCPAPITFDMGGSQQTLSWQPVCDFAQRLATLVRALGALSAGLWLFAMVRR